MRGPLLKSIYQQTKGGPHLQSINWHSKWGPHLRSINSHINGGPRLKSIFIYMTYTGQFAMGHKNNSFRCIITGNLKFVVGSFPIQVNRVLVPNWVFFFAIPSHIKGGPHLKSIKSYYVKRGPRLKSIFIYKTNTWYIWFIPDWSG